MDRTTSKNIEFTVVCTGVFKWAKDWLERDKEFILKKSRGDDPVLKAIADFILESAAMEMP